MYIHNIKIRDTRVNKIIDGTKTICILPLYYNGKQTLGMKNGDIVKISDSKNKEVYVTIKSILCIPTDYPHAVRQFLDYTLSDLGIDAKTGREAKKKYMKWYGKDNINSGLFTFRFEVLQPGESLKF
jgi:hypothetical protein